MRWMIQVWFLEHKDLNEMQVVEESGVSYLLWDGNLTLQMDVIYKWMYYAHIIGDLSFCRYETEFWNDMESLGVRYPNVLVRVTE